MNRSSDATFSRSAGREGKGVPGSGSGAEAGAERPPAQGPEQPPAQGPEASSHADSFGPDSGTSSGPGRGSASPQGSVFHADPALADSTLADDTWVAALPEGFAGRLSFRGAGSLGYDQTVSALQRLGMLVSWAQAQQARVAARLEVLFARDIAEASGREEPALALSLAAAEASAVLNIPHMTAMQLISDSSRLCADAPETLTRLSEGKIALQHARIILEETHNLPTNILEVPEVEAAAGAGPGAGPAAAGAAADAVGPASGPAANDPSAKDRSAEDLGQLNLGLDGPSAPGGEGTCPGPSSTPASGSHGAEGTDGADGEGGAHGSGGEGGAHGSDGEGGAHGADGAQGEGGADGEQGEGGAAATAGSDVPAEVLTVRAAFERDLLAAAEGRTAAGFGRRARRLRESRFPDLIPVRHRQAKDKRRVMFQPLPDGMSSLSAIIAAEKGQAMFAALTSAAKAGKRAGDPRTMDQLRADILTELLLEGEPAAEHAPGVGADTSRDSGAADGTGSDSGSGYEAGSGSGRRTGSGFGSRSGPDSGSGGRPGTGSGSGSGPLKTTDTSAAPRNGTIRKDKRPRRAERHRNQNRSKVRTEVMVLINADTLAGLDENPAELNGYGPISAETARTMILDALHWTPLLQDPTTGEILNVGRTRRIPAGLKRWLQARDGTCRFPGCPVSVTHAEIDHTTPFSHGGPTDHSNLEHLCPKHHRFKTLGHWKARQPQPGTIEWDSPTGRTYATDPALDYARSQTPPKQPDRSLEALQADNDPPPF